MVNHHHDGSLWPKLTINQLATHDKAYCFIWTPIIGIDHFQPGNMITSICQEMNGTIDSPPWPSNELHATSLPHHIAPSWWINEAKCQMPKAKQCRGSQKTVARQLIRVKRQRITIIGVEGVIIWLRWPKDCHYSWTPHGLATTLSSALPSKTTVFSRVTAFLEASSTLATCHLGTLKNKRCWNPNSVILLWLIN